MMRIFESEKYGKFNMTYKSIVTDISIENLFVKEVFQLFD